MTLEQKIRNSNDTGVIGVTYNIAPEGSPPQMVNVLNDFEGVLECKMPDGSTSYLNGNKFYTSHEEAFIGGDE